MCVVSMIGDHYGDKWRNPPDWTFIPGVSPTQQEFDELKKEVQEMKELLKRAKQYDIDNNEPDCEIDDKVAVLKKIAKLVDVNLEDVLGEKNAT